jgi:Cu(I)/Ag(I) efflux system membrane fusion protein
MAAEWRTRRPLFISLAGLAAVVVGLWFAQSRGWLHRAEERLRHLTAMRVAEEKGGGASMNMGNMPGMEMTPAAGGGAGQSSKVEGYAALTVAPEIQQRIGVTTGRVEREPLKMSVRTVGIVRPDERRLATIPSKVAGKSRVEKLYVNFTGQEVKAGEPLAELYSPELSQAIQELLTATQRAEQDAPRVQTAPARSLQTDLQEMIHASTEKLKRWGITQAQIDEILRQRKSGFKVPILAPIGGTVVQKNVVQGQEVQESYPMFEIADLSLVWVQAKVYEYELPHVELGMPATVTAVALPNRSFSGKVIFVQPIVEEATRTVQVRVELPNRDGALKPGMFAEVEIAHTMGEGLLVPTSAVIRTGERDIAFRVEQGDHFVPVEVKIDTVKFGDRFHVLHGLDVGDRVVTSANFLIDSESRLRVGGGGMQGMNMGGEGQGMSMQGQGKGGQGGATTKGRHEDTIKGMDMDGMGHPEMKH